MKYSLIELGSEGQDAQIFTGMCLPESCTDEIIKREIDSAFKIVGASLEVYLINSNP